MSIDTVNDLPPRVQYVASAAQTVFPYPFPIFDGADLDVYVDGALKTLFTQYTVSGEGDDAGGNVTLVTPLAGGEIVTIVRNIAIERDTDISQNGPWSSEAYNNELDKIILILQELKADFRRSLRISTLAEVDDEDIELAVASFANMYLAFDADGKPVPAVLSAQTLTQQILGQLFRPRTTAEIAAAVVPTNYAYFPADDLGDMARYGAAGNSTGVAGVGTDDTTAFRKACLVIQQQGGGLLNLGTAKYRLFSDGTTAALGAFTNLRSFELRGNGTLVDDRTYTGNQTHDFFTFTACENINLGNGIALCTQIQPANEKTTRGPTLARFLQGCKNIRAGVWKVTGFREVWHPERAAGDPESYASRGFDLGVLHATDCGYPFAPTLSGYGVKLELHTLRCGRSYFPTGGYDHQIVVFSQDHEASVDCLLTTDAGQGMRGLKLKYYNTESTFADDSRNFIRLEIQDSELYDAIIRDLDIEFRISNSSASVYGGYAFQVTKYTSADVVDTVDRGHIIENVCISGSVNAGSANQRSLDLFTQGTWGTGEFVRNFRIRDMHLRGVGQPNIALTSLQDKAVIDNVYCSAQMNVSGNTTGKIILLGVECDGSITGSAADTSRMTFIGCKIGSMTNQSVTNKKFIDCEGLGTSYTATGTGFGSPPAGSIGYTVTGSLVTLDIPSISATSNSTALTFTGMPVQIRPAANQLVIGRYTDNGADGVGLVRVETDGTLRFFNQAASSTFFTGSGIKGTPAQILTYRMSAT